MVENNSPTIYFIQNIENQIRNYNLNASPTIIKQNFLQQSKVYFIIPTSKNHLSEFALVQEHLKVALTQQNKIETRLCFLPYTVGK